MANYTTRYLSIKFGAKQVTLFPYPVKEGEVDLNGITVTATDIEIPAGASATVKYTHSDGNTMVYFAQVNGQQITFPIVTTTEGTGTMLFEVSLYIGNDLYKSATYKYEIVESLGYINISSGDMQLIQQIALAEQARVEAEALRVTEHANRMEQMRTAITNAQNATVNANSAANNCYEETTIMVDRINNAISAGTVDLETKLARVDMVGFEHPDLNARLNTDLNRIAEKVPTNLNFKGIETITADNTVSGNVNNGVVSGETLVNLARSTVTLSSTIDSTTGGAGSYYGLNNFIRPLKSNTEYTLAFTVSNLNVEAGIPLMTVRGNATDGSFMFYTAPPGYRYQNGSNVVKIQTREKEMRNFLLGVEDSASNLIKCDISDVLVLEGDHTDKPLEFFEGLKSAEINEMETHGVNMLNIKPPYSGNANYHTDISLNSLNVIGDGVKKYRFVNKSNERMYFRVTKAGEPLVNSPVVEANRYSDYIIPKGYRVSLVHSYNVTTHELRASSFAIYEITPNTPTTYIPYESTKLTTPENVILRSLPNGVADTLNLETGELTRRCGEVVFDGSENWINSTPWEAPDTKVFHCKPTPTIKTTSTINLYSDKFIAKGLVNGGSTECIYGGDTNTVFVSILASKLTTPDVAGFKAWLSENPTTVVYQLAEPTTEIIDLDGYLKSHDYQTTITAPSVIPVKLSFDIPVSLKHWLESNTLTNQLLQNKINQQQIKIEEFDLFKTRLVTTFSLLIEQLSKANTLPVEEVENLEQKLQGLL